MRCPDPRASGWPALRRRRTVVARSLGVLTTGRSLPARGPCFADVRRYPGVRREERTVSSDRCRRPASPAASAMPSAARPAPGWPPRGPSWHRAVAHLAQSWARPWARGRAAVHRRTVGVGGAGRPGQIGDHSGGAGAQQTRRLSMSNGAQERSRAAGRQVALRTCPGRQPMLSRPPRAASARSVLVHLAGDVALEGADDLFSWCALPCCAVRRSRWCAGRRSCG